jgi:peroxiredoxin
MTTFLVFALILPWLLIGFGGWLGYQLVRQNGRVLLRLEGLEQALQALRAEPARPAPAAPDARGGLSMGTMAPEFELPDLTGARRRLAEFRGRRVLLMFFNPGCGFCTAMAPELAALAPEGREGQPVPLVVSTGEAEANRQLVKTHAIRGPVLLQKQMEVASQYQVNGTPMGYLLDETGAIASELAVGAPALLALAAAPAPPAKPEAAPKPAARGNKPLSESRLNRSGLKAGTPARASAYPGSTGKNWPWRITGAGGCCWSLATRAAAPATNWPRTWSACTAKAKTCRCSWSAARTPRPTGRRRPSWDSPSRWSCSKTGRSRACTACSPPRWVT